MSKIITVGREFGSGGRELGRRLAEELGIQYYDKEIICRIAESTEMSEEYISRVVESKKQVLFPITIGQSFSCATDYYARQIQEIYGAQTQIIKELAEKSDCVIIGRCADYILRDLKPVRLFVYADMESRMKRCIERSSRNEKLTPRELERKINSIDKDRAHYYNEFTGQKWGDKRFYDLCINTSDMDIKKAAPYLAKIF